MKKLVLAVFLTVFAGMAMADNHDKRSSIGVSYAFRDSVGDNKNDPNRQGVNVTYGFKFNPNWSVDLNQQFRTDALNSDNSNNSTRLESGLTYTLPLVAGFSAYTRAGIGHKFSGGDDASYYTVEPGVKYQWSQQLTLRTAFRYRDAFSSAANDHTNT